jgi:homoserine dehydrogenase
VVGVEAPRVKVGVLGCGNVGGALVQLLRDDADGVARRTGLRLEVAKVAVRSTTKERSVDLPPDVVTHDAESVVADPDIDVIVEVIGGIEPARSLILHALKAGKPVVTANKELLANVGSELFEAAAASGVDLLYEASVAGGIPLIRPLRESLAGERIKRVMGIVNGTTNFILTRMTEEGTSYADALAEAPSPSATPRPTWRATTPGPRPPSSPASPSACGWWRATCTARGSAASPQLTSPSPVASATS